MRWRSPLRQVIRDAHRLASGDLSQPVQTGAPGTLGQLQQSLHQLSVNLRTVVRDVRQQVNYLGEAVREVAAGNHDLSTRTETQAASLEKTAAAMEEINSMVGQSASAAQVRNWPPRPRTSPRTATRPCSRWPRP
jgi:aerotaxis receptor